MNARHYNLLAVAFLVVGIVLLFAHSVIKYSNKQAARDIAEDITSISQCLSEMRQITVSSDELTAIQSRLNKSSLTLDKLQHRQDHVLSTKNVILTFYFGCAFAGSACFLAGVRRKKESVGDD